MNYMAGVTSNGFLITIKGAQVIIRQSPKANLDIVIEVALSVTMSDVICYETCLDPCSLNLGQEYERICAEALEALEHACVFAGIEYESLHICSELSDWAEQEVALLIEKRPGHD